MKYNVAKKSLTILIIFVLLVGIIKIPHSDADVETHVSSITGKTFTEYKQNDYHETNLSYGGTLDRNGCALTMVANIANGYGKNITPSDVNKSYPSSFGIRQALKDYTGQDIPELTSVSETTVIEKMKEGDVIWISWKSREHHSAVVDLDEQNKKVYVINSYRGESLNGWQPISDVISQCYVSFIKTDGQAYASTTSSSAATTSSGLTYTSSGFNSPSCIKSNGRNGYKINLDLDKEIDNMLKDIDTGKSGIKSCLSNKNKTEYLRDFVKAEIITQYPDLRSAEEITADNTYEKVKAEVKALLPNLLENMDSIGRLDDSILSNEQIENNLKEYSSYKTNVIEKSEIDASEEYVRKKIKNKSVQNKILKIIESNDVSQNKVHEILGGTISSKLNCSSNLVEKYYLAYINKLTEELNLNVVNFDKFYTGIINENTDSDKEKELQGCIKVKRVPATGEEDDDSAYFMAYMPSREFEKLLSNYESSGDETFKKYFTLDTSGNLIVATGEFKSVFNISTHEYEYEYIAKKSSINYLDQVSNYTMPFELLWTLLVYSQDENFVDDIAKLVMNSDIVISVYENTAETKKTENKKTKNYSEKEVTTTYKDENGNEKEVKTTETEEYVNEETYYINYTTNNTQAMISYADTWIATYTYAIIKKQNTDRNNYTTEENNEVSKENASEKSGETDKISDNQKQEIINKIVEQDGIDYVKKQVMMQYIEGLEVGQAISSNSKPLPVTLDSKTKNVLSNDKKIQEIIYQMINAYSPANSLINVTLEQQCSLQIKEELKNKGLNDTEQQYSADVIIRVVETIATKYNFQNEDEFKKQIVNEYFESISNKVTVKKWNDATQVNIGETTERTEYVTSNGTVISKTEKNDTKDNFVKILCNHSKARNNIRSISGWMFESIEHNEYICNMLDLIKYLLQKTYGSNLGVSDYDFSIFDPKNFKSISGGNTASGGAGYSTLNITQDDLEILYKITSAEWGTGSQEQQEYIASVILNRVLCTDWPNTIRDVVYQEGQFQPTWDGGIDRVNPSETTKAAVNAVIQKGDTTGGAVGFMTDWCFEDNRYWINEANGWKELFRESDTNGATVVFFTKISAFNELKQYATNNGGTNGNIIECAKYVHKYMEDNRYTYGLSNLADTFEESKNTKVVCCATYVSWVLREAGYINETIHSAPTLADKLQTKYNFKKIDGNIQNLQAGDVMVYSGHVQIYAGNGQIYNAGSTDAIQRANPYTSNWGTLLYGLRAP